MGIIKSRKPHFKIDPVFISRRSARVFTGEPVPDEVLLSAVEATRWASWSNFAHQTNILGWSSVVMVKLSPALTHPHG